MKFKKFSGVLALLVAATLAFAFKSVENKKFACVWFTYVGTDQNNTPTYASLANARIPSNWQYSSTAPSCPGANFLCAICVDPSEIYDNSTPLNPNDDTPMVDNTAKDARKAVDASKTGTNGEWVDKTTGTAIIDSKTTL